MTSVGGSSDLLDDILQLSGFNDTSVLCSVNDLTPVQRHEGPSSGAVSAAVQIFRVIFDLYVVGLICLIGFIGE